MGKTFPLMIVSLLVTIVSSKAQGERFVSLRSAVHFNFGLKAPGQDDAGIGLRVDVSMFSKKKLNLVLSAHGNRFIGDKSLTIPDVGRVNKGGAIYGVEAGPEYFVNRHVSVGVGYGWYWHSFQTRGFTADDGYRLNFTIFPGGQKSFMIQVARTAIPSQVVGIRYYSVGLGYRFM